ncbi:MAG: hypothetical protein U0074_15960 [Kouleothrix sp.]
MPTFTASGAPVAPSARGDAFTLITPDDDAATVRTIERAWPATSRQTIDGFDYAAPPVQTAQFGIGARPAPRPRQPPADVAAHPQRRAPRQG